jgi:hypothetical protein
VTVTNRPKIEAYIGASGSGKGVSINRRLQALQPARLLVWDPRDEYRDHGQAHRTLPAVVDVLRKAGAGPFRVRYVPGAAVPLADAFGLLCRLAFEAGTLVFVAEELSDVTTASHAPAAWRQVITQGRHRGLHVLGAAQRPALIDKTFLGNATLIRCFGLRYAADRAAMAAALDVPVRQVEELATTEQGSRVVIRWIERDWRAGTVAPGSLTLRRRS